MRATSFLTQRKCTVQLLALAHNLASMLHATTLQAIRLQCASPTSLSLSNTRLLRCKALALSMLQIMLHCKLRLCLTVRKSSFTCKTSCATTTLCSSMPRCLTLTATFCLHMFANCLTLAKLCMCMHKLQATTPLRWNLHCNKKNAMQVQFVLALLLLLVHTITKRG